MRLSEERGEKMHKKKWVLLSFGLAAVIALQRPMELNAQVRSTTDWIKVSSNVIAGDYDVTHYMNTYRMESNTAEWWKTETLHQGSYIYTQHGYSVMQYISNGKVVDTTGRVKAEYGNMAYVSEAVLNRDGILYSHQAYCGIDMNN